MRSATVIAFTTSIAVHAAILGCVPPLHGASRAGAPHAAAPTVITAQLKNTLDGTRSAAARSAPAARAMRSAGRHFAAERAPRAIRVAARRGGRIDNRLQFYPPEAITQGLEGEAIVMLRIGDDGDVLAAQIAKSSGHVILDEAALRAIRVTPRFAPGPREILFPVSFALR